MIGRLGLALLAMITLSPVQAETFDDATCGLIAEYVMDIGYDQGAPLELTPQGRIFTDAEGCVMTDVLVAPSGPTGLMVERVKWTGEGLADWVAGKGWPTRLEINFEGAYMWASLPDYPEMEWASRITARRSAVAGAADISWDPAAGVLNLQVLELGLRHNFVRLTGLASGIAEGPFAQSIPTLRVHALEIGLGFDGMFEAIALTPFAVSMLAGRGDPGTAFDDLIAVTQSYVAALPDPQVDRKSVLNLDAFLTSLPSPTGRFQMFLKAGGGIRLIDLVPLVVELDAPDPDKVGALIGKLAGSARLTVNWFPGPRN